MRNVLKAHLAQDWAAHDPGIYVCHDETGDEWKTDELPSGYRDLWQYAICQVDSRKGGYVREYDAAGQLVRQHPTPRETT